MPEIFGRNERHKHSVNEQFSIIVAVCVIFIVVFMSTLYVVIEFGYAGHGEFYKRRGVVKHILGTPHSQAYHEITKTEGGFIAKIGARPYKLDEEGRRLAVLSWEEQRALEGGE